MPARGCHLVACIFFDDFPVNSFAPSMASQWKTSCGIVSMSWNIESRGMCGSSRKSTQRTRSAVRCVRAFCALGKGFRFYDTSDSDSTRHVEGPYLDQANSFSLAMYEEWWPGPLQPPCFRKQSLNSHVNDRSLIWFRPTEEKIKRVKVHIGD